MVRTQTISPPNMPSTNANLQSNQSNLIAVARIKHGHVVDHHLPTTGLHALGCLSSHAEQRLGMLENEHSPMHSAMCALGTTQGSAALVHNVLALVGRVVGGEHRVCARRPVILCLQCSHSQSPVTPVLSSMAAGYDTSCIHACIQPM